MIRKLSINQYINAVTGQPTGYVIDDDAFWNQSHFSNLWAIQYGTATG